MASKKTADHCEPSDEDSQQVDNTLKDENCSISSVSSVNGTVDPSSKSFLRREALRQSQLAARGQHNHRRSSTASSNPGAYPSYPLPEVSLGSAAATRAPRFLEGGRGSSLLQAKAEIGAAATTELDIEDDNACPEKTSSAALQSVRNRHYSSIRFTKLRSSYHLWRNFLRCRSAKRVCITTAALCQTT